MDNNGKKILVIEDNAEVRENLCEILELAGYSINSAENGKIGVERVFESLPDLILCDVMMPELDGFGVLKILENNSQVNQIPLIFLTAKVDRQDIRKGMGLGASDYLTKPFDDTELLEAVETRLKKTERLMKVNPASQESLPKPQILSESRGQVALVSLARLSESRQYNINDLIYRQGDLPRWLFYIDTGSVKMCKSNDQGKELTVRLLNKGEFFGHFNLLRRDNYSGYVVALEDTMVRMIPKDEFLNLLYNNPDFATMFIKSLGSDVEEAEKQLIQHAYGSVRKKVASALLAFATNTTNQSTVYTFIETSRDNLASKAGIAKETLIRTLSDFKSEQLISTEQKKITLLDPQRLEKMLD